VPVESQSTDLADLPDVTLPDLDGTPLSLHELAQDRPLVVVFACNHCPYVQSIETELGVIARTDERAAFVAICSNDVDAYPEDDVPGLREQAARAGWSFPYLVDTSQSVARMFGAVCTPDFFVFDASGELVYRGAMDDARPRQPQAVDGAHLTAAIDAACSGDSFTGGKPAMGCGIKWKE
jgi:peroxiredoxin